MVSASARTLRTRSLYHGRKAALTLAARKFRSGAMAKFDPYINVDPGTMSPFQHGEVYVTDDGAETDLDLGHYERFTTMTTSRTNNTTAGRIYATVIEVSDKEDKIIVKIADNVRVKITKAAIARNITNEEEAAKAKEQPAKKEGAA